MDFLGPLGTQALLEYWQCFLADKPEHYLSGESEDRRLRTLPIVLYGDEGSVGPNSFMLGTWMLGQA